MGWENIQQGHGVLLMIVGMTVVFSALVLLMFLMKLLKRYEAMLHFRVQKKSSETGDPLSITGPDGSTDIPGVTVAAIALTLILEEESVHDEESLVLTLHAIPRPYSNWWQSRIERFWPVNRSAPQKPALRAHDPERGTKV
jgi:Na+-transporting methylmalonyl-CoA/oxaloacetate decarboxylase gamma subunit